MLKSTLDNLLFVIDRYPALFMVGIFIAGIIFWGGFNLAMESTNTMRFCISCHEMRDNVYREYVNTIHYHNPTGIQAACPDCHVPREWVYKMVRKVNATNELYHHFAGSIDTREKFEHSRLDLARLVWDTMANTDSRECRNCHDMKNMDVENQATKSAIFHRYAMDNSKTCIHCHKGIAHSLPADYVDDAYQQTLDDMHRLFEKQGQDCGICHEALNEAGGWYD